MFASILAALTAVSNLIMGIFKLFNGTESSNTQGAIDDERKKLDEFKKTGRPPQ